MDAKRMAALKVIVDGGERGVRGYPKTPNGKRYNPIMVRGLAKDLLVRSYVEDRELWWVATDAGRKAVT